jgi:Fructose-1-6-bisphosphatase, N-terminal domain
MYSRSIVEPSTKPQLKQWKQRTFHERLSWVRLCLICWALKGALSFETHQPRGNQGPRVTKDRYHRPKLSKRRNRLNIPLTSGSTTLLGDLASMGSASIPVTSITGPSKQMRKKKLQTFTRYLEVECWKRQDLRGLEPVLQAVSSACIQINRIVQRAQTDDVYGVAVDAEGNPLSDNVQGEIQQKLDVLCNTIMLKAFCGSGREICSVASEEEDEPRSCADVMVRDNIVLHVESKRWSGDSECAYLRLT